MDIPTWTYSKHFKLNAAKVKLSIFSHKPVLPSVFSISVCDTTLDHFLQPKPGCHPWFVPLSYCGPHPKSVSFHTKIQLIHLFFSVITATTLIWAGVDTTLFHPVSHVHSCTNILMLQPHNNQNELLTNPNTSVSCLKPFIYFLLLIRKFLSPQKHV